MDIQSQQQNSSPSTFNRRCGKEQDLLNRLELVNRKTPQQLDTTKFILDKLELF